MLQPDNLYPEPFDVQFNVDWLRPHLNLQRVWYIVWLVLLVNAVWVLECVFRLLYTLDGTITTNLGSLCVIDVLLSLVLTARIPFLHRVLFRWSFHEAYPSSVVLKGAAMWAGLLHSIIMLSVGYTNLDMFGPVSTGILIMVLSFITTFLAVFAWGRWYHLAYQVPSYILGLLLFAFGVTHFVAVRGWFPLTIACISLMVEGSHLSLAWRSWFSDWRVSGKDSAPHLRSANILQMRMLPGNVVQVVFAWNQAYRAGQFAYVCIPQVSSTVWKPFSLSQAPCQRSKTKYEPAETASIHVRCRGNNTWTDALMVECQETLREVLRADEDHRAGLQALGVAKDNDRDQVGISIAYPTLYIDGPHGVLCPDNLSPYQAFLFISGGIGVTPLQAIYNQLIYERQAHDRRFLTSFNWVVREQEELLRRGLEKQMSVDEMRYLHFQPNLIDWKRVSNLAATHHQLQFYLSRADNLDNVNFQAKVAVYEPKARRFPAPKHLQFRDPSPLFASELIETFHADCVRHNVKRSVVFVCGPTTLVDDVKAAVSKLDLDQLQLELRVERFLLSTLMPQ